MPRPDARKKDKKDKDIVNAISLPGGYIYVFKNLMKLAETDDELMEKTFNLNVKGTFYGMQAVLPLLDGNTHLRNVAAAPDMERDDVEWQKGVDAQKGDGYGLGVYGFAEAWARLMQAKIAEGCALADVADELEERAVLRTIHRRHLRFDQRLGALDGLVLDAQSIVSDVLQALDELLFLRLGVVFEREHFGDDEHKVVEAQGLALALNLVERLVEALVEAEAAHAREVEIGRAHV